MLQKYLASLEDKARTIKALWEKKLEGDPSALDEIRLHAHSLKGSGATFGFPEISKAGAELEKANDTEFRDKLVYLLNLLGSKSARVAPVADVTTAPVSNVVDLSGIGQQAVSTQALVIERNRDNAQAISRCIVKLDGIEECVVVHTGAEAREAYLNTRFSLIVLDIVLPDRDGREILREIKSTPELNNPVLVISGVPSDEIYLECMKIGADQYLSKPFDTDRLYFESRQVLQQAALKSAAPVPADDQQAAKQLSSLKGEKILVAEDDEMQALFIAEKLQDQGAEVSIVENGRLALEALENNGFSAVILDGMMPVMDGFETLTRIRANPRLKGLPAIMVTAMGSEQDIIRGYQNGANDYILKPFSEEQLVARIKNLLVMAA